MDDQATSPSAEPTPPTQPIAPTVPKSSKRKPIIFTVVAIILIAVAGYGAYRIERSRAIKVENSQQAQITALQKQVNSLQKTSVQNSPSGTAANNNPYAGWKTYTLSSLGLSFMYPSSWTVTKGQQQCTGAIQISITPGATELSSAASTIGATLKQYTVFVNKYGTESSKCAPDGNNFKGVKYNYLQSSDEIQAGLFKNNWLTWFGSSSGETTQLTPTTGTLPDTGIVTDAKYSASPNTFIDAGTVSANDSTYQIEVNTSSVVGQQYTSPVPMNISLLKTTDLYKDTLNILNSM